jgi:GNAT superfamily N-acetyltransferase
MGSNFEEIHPRVAIRPYELGESLPFFDCGKPWFNDFINTQEVESYQRKRLGKTRIVHLDGAFAAYFCLSPNSMANEDYSDDATAAGSELYDGPFDMPARLLGHLAVDECFQGEGLGEYLVKHIIAASGRSMVPFRVVILHARGDTIGFYRKFGFAKALPEDGGSPNTTLMFYDLGHIAE